MGPHRSLVPGYTVYTNPSQPGLVVLSLSVSPDKPPNVMLGFSGSTRGSSRDQTNLILAHPQHKYITISYLVITTNDNPIINN